MQAARKWGILLAVLNIKNAMKQLLARRRRKKAILIAMNYDAPSDHGIGPLMCPRRDLKEMCRLLKDTFGFQDENIIILTDDVAEVEEGRSLAPTRENIMLQIKEFIVHGQDNTDYVFFYSGHSHQDNEPLSDVSFEEDGLREFLLPVDARIDNNGEYLPESVIYDTYLHENIIVPLEKTKGSHLFALFDSCHSCTLMNLKHYRCNRVGTATSAVRRAVRHYIIEDIFVPLRDRFFPNPPKVKPCDGLCPRLPNLSRKSITICMSACKDSEIAFEVGNSRTLTSAIVGVLEANPKASLKDVMHSARCAVGEALSEAHQAAKKAVDSRASCADCQNATERTEQLRRWNPQLSSNDPLDTNTTLMYSDPHTHIRNRHGRVKRPVWESLRRLIPRTVTNYISLPTGASPRRMSDAS